ncbi:hypothetical protein [Dyadobacter fermentans]|uniref:Uncharacterized protein n=1 Tax=Dyadobacter fermentans (strain ATCC 700827 / DSM 18053 / CIP 107007 / KCTC 52180 / NS114) TaxID=471854 RepID=C6VVT8_DYAFD|nr:hypothetical protein [Dyadobacter fermentans]ACT91394.1 hypothetical protein Dfer_0123 [Dyadobacter fermentans DSM 18053]
MKNMLLLLVLTACNQPTTGWPDPVPGEPFVVATAEDSARTNGPFMRIHPMGQHPEMIHDNIDRLPTLKIAEWLSAPTALADFGRILKPGEAMEMVAFGGGMTAGVMNGGITRESQQTNYTNLLAHQMGIKNFEMPLFDKERFNGTGYYVYRNTESGHPQWDRVVNNTISALPGDPPTMPEYLGKVSNYALPEGGSEWFNRGYACENCALIQLGLSRFKRYVPPYPSEAFLKIKADVPYNFAIIDEFFDRWLRGIRMTSQIGIYDIAFNGSIQLTGRITDHAINKVLQDGQKGVIFTIPRYQDLPYMNWYSRQELTERGSGLYISFDRNGVADQLIDASRPFSMIPSAKLHHLFENFSHGGEFRVNFKDFEVIDEAETFMSDPQQHYNGKIREYAAEKDLAVVDLFDLYQRIHQGGYKTDDGIEVDGTPYGNFFSSDGIYPTPLGQAIITNEVIKAINKHYGAKIPLIDIAAFVRTTGFEK